MRESLSRRFSVAHFLAVLIGSILVFKLGFAWLMEQPVRWSTTQLMQIAAMCVGVLIARQYKRS